MGVTKRAGRRKDGAQGGAPTSGRKQAIFDSSKKKDVGLSDLTLVSKITEEAINDNLKLRFEHGEIYTYIGHVLVSVNPFRQLPIYGDDTKKIYEGKNRLEAAPHVYSVAESAYHQMRQYEENQCVIISGESGAGKTEAAKRLMEYICYRTGAPESFEVTGARSKTMDPSNIIKEKVLSTNPLLEAFGNAKTLRNNNSSRFGKYLDLQFKSSKGQRRRQGRQMDGEEDGTRNVLEPVGASIRNYLLEKSRVVGQTVNERNFHIFYQFTKSQPQQYRDAFGISGPETFEYLSRAKCLDAPGIDDKADFAEVMKAMDTIEINGAERDNIFRVLATILWLGNVTFQEDDSGNATIRDESVSQYVAYLLEVDHAKVVKALTLRLLKTAGEEYDVPLNVAQAIAVRDALSKGLYFNLFDWIVQKLNVSLNARNDAIDNTIGILDIYGFEIFEKNSFEQLCINYVNEKLQQIFIQLTLKAEQEDYAKEQIKWTPIKYFDNKIVCELIEEKRPPGIFAALNDACATAHADPAAADQTFVQRLNGLSNPHFQPRQGQFVIKHYAGEVNYAIEGMTDKNKDQLLKDLLRLLGGSRNTMVNALFPNAVNEDDRRRPPTAGDKIKTSANDLVTTLMKCAPSYIRTIKPNENKSSSEYNTGNVLHQIKYLGLQENVRIRRAGFAYRQDFEKFFNRFFPLSRTISPGVEIRQSWASQFGGDYLSGVKTILKDTRIPQDQYQIGITRVFIKDPETIFHLEDARDKHFDVLVRRIQKRYRKRKGDRVTESQQLRELGHQVLQDRKERRRFSLLGSRRFLGDYLGLNLTGGYGEVVRRSMDLGNESVIFSARCEILVTKFGRSSKPEPRMLILTTHAVHIMVVNLVNQQATIQTERKVPLGAIKYVSASTLKDDWFSLGIASPQEPDPLLSCVFKTEFFTLLSQKVSRGSITVKIGEAIEYNKKPGKPATVKAVKDPSVPRDDFYKSGTIHTDPGESPRSRSRPTPKGKDDDKEIEGTVSEMSLASSRPAVTRPRPQPAVPSVSQSSLPQAQAASRPLTAASAFGQKREGSTPRAVPTPPPPPPAAPAAVKQKPMLKALYDFDGGGHTQFPIAKDDIFEDLKEEQNGWSKVARETNEEEGWAPTAYLEKYTPPAPTPAPPPAPPSLPIRAVPAIPSQHANGTNSRGPSPQPAASGKPTPPMPPKRPAVKGKKPAPPPSPRDSAVSLSNGASGRATPESTESGKVASDAATNLANLLRARGAKSNG